MEPRSEKWDERAIRQVNHAIATFTSELPMIKRAPHIVWGYANKDDERKDRSFSRKFQQPEALLSYCDHDFHLHLSNAGDPSYPDWLHLALYFERPAHLPTDDTQLLYNVLANCQPQVRLAIIPRPAGGPAGVDVIDVVECHLSIPVENLTARLLRSALFDLQISTSHVWSWLTKDEGDDHWSMDAALV